jgi:hypothetical protein
MNSKLTLTIDNTVVKNAKRYARSRGRSLSDIVENYLKMITRDNIDPDFETTPIVNSLRGSFRAHDDIDYKQELSKGLSDKYLENEEDSD